MSESKYTPGRFVWRELITNDIEASRRFYGELLNWKIDKANGVPGMDYWEISAGGRKVGGMFQMSQAGVPNFWGSYVSVADVDAAANAAKANGGAVLNGPMEIPNVGRFATLRDPQGAVLNVFKDAKGDQPQGMPKEGEFCWEALNTSDTAAAKSFYTKVVGWQVAPFGPGMEVFATGPGPQDSAASFHQAPPGVPPHWLTHVVVPVLADANARATRLGAKVMMDRIEVPTVGAFSVIQDNVGAIIALFTPKM